MIAVVLAAVGKLLLEHGMKNDDVAGFLGRVWNANIPSPNNTVPMLPIVTDAPVIDSAAVLGAGQVLLGILGVAWVAWAA